LYPSVFIEIRAQCLSLYVEQTTVSWGSKRTSSWTLIVTEACRFRGQNTEL